MLLACVSVYLTFAVPALAIIWAALIVEKNSDRSEVEDDFESTSHQELNLLARLVEFE